ncbi:BREX system Lon protease-like protein BrxL [Natroniella sulfidigena]|uniref:BREX system Lon protease-like protein BrxL n=1 Tax=Natroniella sulfidigena TaxID=723921 RepID=UPI00200A8115|nr:BREX system Lon protease-like protein BrxL [Natroniella sulfidigena]MCK8816694.1 BREX system Lon protease-like protein BrxL [Natroniella sulfidigena]
MALIDNKAERVFPKQIIDKELVQQFKGNLSLPTYLIENLILTYQDDETSLDEIEQLLNQQVVKTKDDLKVQNKIRQADQMIIDKIMVKIRNKAEYEAQVLNLGLKKAKIKQEVVKKYPGLLENGVWAKVSVSYLEDQNKFEITELTPIYNTNFDLEEFKEKREEFTDFQWRCFLLRSIGFEPLDLSERKKLLYLSRLISFVEKNYNFIELGSRGTGKSYTYRQLSEQSILVSGGKTTVANLFYNMGTKQVGLVGKWDVVAFDEVAYIDFKDKTAVQILKDYMESGSFSRGQEEIVAEASMVFLGNINQDISVLINQSHLFKPLPQVMQDIALIDRFHFYLPGWEMERLKEDCFTTHYGLQSSYLAQALAELRELDFKGVLDEHFEFDQKMDVRDKRAVKKTVAGFLKLLHPHGKFDQKDLRSYLDLALEGRKRVKEQLIKMAPFEYEETSFNYVEQESGQQFHIYLPEQRMDTGYRRELAKPGTVYIGQILESQKFALLKLEIKIKAGQGKLLFTGQLDHNLKKQIRKTFLHLKNRKLNLRLKNKVEQNDFYVKVTSLMHQVTADISNAFLIAVYSLLNNKSVPNGLLITEESSLYRKAKSNFTLKALKVESETGKVKTLLPLQKDNIFIEVPSEVIAYAPYFIKV